MDRVPDQSKVESIASLQSAIAKSEKALAQMTRKGADTTLVSRRLQALIIGLAVLERAWQQRPSNYPPEDLAAARLVLTALLPSIRSIYVRSKPGSPQRTLMERRIRALELAIQAIGEATDR